MSNNGSEWRRWDLHVHTASSYDYGYSGEDADDLLCDALKENEIKAVAITDHFTIDKDRIKSLREKAPDIVFFPGVELRTDKGSNNLHLILIFSDKSDLNILTEDFDVIMLREKAKAKEDNETIYWLYDDIVEFAKNHGAIITIHAGHKSNGIDKEISNALPVKEAIKSDIARNVDFFEIGQIRDIEDYKNHVFKDIDEKPLIICSDCHNPKEYSPREYLWIKSDLTFEGLTQCIYQPSERVFLGTIPPVLDRFEKNKQNNISEISIRQISDPKNRDENWFNVKISLNPGMNAIIGNKGSGKSALSDILGLLCDCDTIDQASFLNDERFRKSPKNLANDYIATLTWADGKCSEKKLSDLVDNNGIQDAQYLPQRYIENVCNEFGDDFQSAINSVIFSYVDPMERGGTKNLDELIRFKTKHIESDTKKYHDKLKDINSQIINLEDKMTDLYRTQTENNLKKAKETLDRHKRSKPSEVKKPETKGENTEYSIKLDELNQLISKDKMEIEEITDEISIINDFINEVSNILDRISSFEDESNEMQALIHQLIEQYNLQSCQLDFDIKVPKEALTDLVYQAKERKKSLQNKLNNKDTGLNHKLRKDKDQKEELISKSTIDEKLYQKYLSDYAEWEDKRQKIIGDDDTDGSIKFYEHALKYLNEDLDSDYESAIHAREEITRNLYQGKIELAKIYKEIYDPIQKEISTLLEDISKEISFQAEIYMNNSHLAEDIVEFIDQRYSGKFGHSHNSIKEIEELIKMTQFDDIDSIMVFISNIVEAATEDINAGQDRIMDRQGFYDAIYGLNYIGVDYKLKMEGKGLAELSPGEKGLVLLIFYLALSKGNNPIIIDQPEDNLDNQSVFSKLVPCICNAKLKRQVIIVTHNPNIAVACDAEQIIYCEMDKNKNQFNYETGSIENPEMRKHVVDVLEGTMPAFDLRRRKYTHDAIK